VGLAGEHLDDQRPATVGGEDGMHASTLPEAWAGRVRGTRHGPA
jgi:hypothetical protein